MLPPESKISVPASAKQLEKDEACFARLIAMRPDGSRYRPHRLVSGHGSNTALVRHGFGHRCCRGDVVRQPICTMSAGVSRRVGRFASKEWDRCADAALR
jgi:hypothetical protein